MHSRFINIFILLLLLIIGNNNKTATANEDYRYALALMQERKEYRTAISKFRKYIKENPAEADTPKAIFYMASCLAKTGKDTSAGNSYEQLIKLYPNTDRELLLQATAYGADAYFRAENYNKAIDLYSIILSRYPESTECETALYWSAEAYNRLLQKNKENKELYTKAITSYQKLENKFPQSRFLQDAKLSAGLLAFSFKKYTEAIPFFSAYLKNASLLIPEKKELALYHLGESLYWEKDYQQAEQYFKKIISEYPSGKYLAESYSGLGWCAYSLNDQPAAAKNFSQAAQKHHNSKQAINEHFNAAVAFTQAGIAGKAENEYRNIIHNSPNSKSQISLLKLGTLLKKHPDKHKQEEAEILFRQAYNYTADNIDETITIEAGILLAEILVKKYKYIDAENIYHNIANNYPDSKYISFALYQLALTQAELKKYKKASLNIKKLLKNYPESSFRLQAAYAIADYQNKLGQTEKSRIAYQWLSTKGIDWAKKYCNANKTENPDTYLKEAKNIAAASLLHLAESLYTQENNQQAIEKAKNYFTDYVNRFPENPRTAAALLRLGELTEKSNPDIAEKYFQNTINTINNLNKDQIDTELANVFLHAQYRLCINLLFQAQNEIDTTRKNQLFTQTLNNINNFILNYKNDSQAEKLLPQILFYKAEAENYFNNTDTACENYLASYNADKNSSTADSALFSCAMIEHKKGEMQKAGKKLAIILRDYPKSQYIDNALYILAIYKRSTKDYNQGIKYLNELTDSFPTSELYQKSQLEKAKIYIAQKNYLNAEELLNNLLEISIDKDNIIVNSLYNLALIYSYKLENDKLPAVQKKNLKNNLQNKLITIATDYPAYTNINIVKIQLAEYYYKEKKYQKAINWYNNSLNDNNKFQDKVHYRLAWCYLKLSAQDKQFTKKALKEFFIICNDYSQSPLYAECAIRAAKIMRENNDYNKALDLYNNALKENLSEPFAMNALYGKSLTLLYLNKYNSAYNNFKKYIQKYPESPLFHEANWGVGQAALMLGADADAADYFNIAKANGYNGKVAAQARYGLGLIALNNNNYKEARDEFRKVDVFHKQWQNIAAAALLKAAEASHKLGEEETAINDLKRIIKLYSSTSSAKTAEEMLLAEVK